MIETKIMGKSMSSTSLEAMQATLKTANSAVHVHAEIAAILVYNRVHPLIYWLLICNNSITYFIPVSLENRLVLKLFS